VGCVNRIMPREAMQVRLICKGFFCLFEVVFVITAMRVTAVPEQSWYLGYSR
jgi:hypothetical protein